MLFTIGAPKPNQLRLIGIAVKHDILLTGVPNLLGWMTVVIVQSNVVTKSQDVTSADAARIGIKRHLVRNNKLPVVSHIFAVLRPHSTGDDRSIEKRVIAAQLHSIVRGLRPSAASSLLDDRRPDSHPTTPRQ